MSAAQDKKQRQMKLARKIEYTEEDLSKTDSGETGSENETE